MKKIELYILWDDIDGYRHARLYLDRKSAEIGLAENYTEFWIKNKRAKLEKIDAVSYFEEDEH